MHFIVKTISTVKVHKFMSSVLTIDVGALL